MSKDSTRVYGRIIDLDGNKVRDFFDKRAIDFTEKARSRNTTVLLGDSDSDYAERWDSFEKGFVLPLLDVKKTDNILDIGCGIGRWAESLIPICRSYSGVDLSDEMIKIAAETYRENQNCRFLNLPFQDVFDCEQIVDREYQIIIITGVSMYLNDSDLGVCYDRLNSVLAPGGVIYMEESVGVNERLSLSNLWSESLNDYYYAVYRTADEYKQLLKPLTEHASVLREGFFDQLDKKELSETGHWYILLKKNAH